MNHHTLIITQNGGLKCWLDCGAEWPSEDDARADDTTCNDAWRLGDLAERRAPIVWSGDAEECAPSFI